ncbi:hypothetical protein O3G_MSEX013154 [Manduca sexta]|nr:hypothetical protein O3G_MSEX013154 [Manduca sexta]
MAAPYFLFPAVLVPVLIINTKCHTANNSDVIVINSGHADVVDQPQNIINEPKTTETTENTKLMIPETTTTEAEIEATEDVVFVPNEKEVQRNFDDDKMKIGDILYRKTVGDIMNDRNVRIETEAPNEDIVFISGKNNENIETSKIERNKEVNIQKKEKPKKKFIDCANLDCNNTLNSVCGVKKDNGHLKYRLFLNDCYFRKVNCNFKYEENRYKQIELERCRNIASHNTERPFSYNPMPLPPPRPSPMDKSRRSLSSRR